MEKLYTYKVGARVRVEHNEQLDYQYDRCSQAGRNLCDCQLVEIIARDHARGESYQVSLNDGAVLAWFALSELKPAKQFFQVALGAKPDPSKFKIVDLQHVGNCTIICANYGGATFNGDKLMVLKGIHESWQIETLDPHFLNEQHPVVARFQPNTTGFELARLTAQHLSQMQHDV